MNTKDALVMNTIRLPLDQFAYIECEFNGTAEEAIDEYKRLAMYFKGEAGEGLSDKEFNLWLDTYLLKSTGDADLYHKMSKQQQEIIQAIKRSMKRIKTKNGEEEID